MNNHIGSKLDDFLKEENIKISKDRLIENFKNILGQGIKDGIIAKDYDVYIPKKLPRKLKKKYRKNQIIPIKLYYRPVTKRVEFTLTIGNESEE